MWDNQYYQTEYAILKSIGIPRKNNGNIAIECKLFPSFFGGNLILVNKDETGNFDTLESLFDRYFNSPKIKHKTFILAENSTNYKQHLEAAKLKGYEITNFSYMTCTPKFTSIQLPDSLVIDRLDITNDPTDIANYLNLLKAGYDLEWFWTEGFKKQQTITNAMSIQWFGLRKKGTPQILSSLGIFKYGDLSRMQEVITHPDHYRKGYATILLQHALNYAIETFQTKEVVIVADRDYHAYNFYQKLGFTTNVNVTEMILAVAMS